MAESRKQKKPVTIVSMNERERRKFVQKLNIDNKAMLERLEHATPVLNAKALEDDFEKHKKLTEYLRRKRLKPITSTSKSFLDNSHNNSETGSSTFDVDSYMSQRGFSALSDGNNVLGDYDSPIKNMADFRKQVITSKRAPNAPSSSSSNGARTSGKASSSTAIKFQNIPGMSLPNSSSPNNVRIEVRHEPTSQTS